MSWLLGLLALAGWIAYLGECSRSKQQQRLLDFYKGQTDFWQQKAQAKTSVFPITQPEATGGCGSHDCQC